MAQLSHNLIGQSPAWLATLDRISGLAAIERPILVVGEPGTGKTVVAGRLHFLSQRWEQSWQDVNCAALSEQELDTEIFGGTAFARDSLLERAEGGTLFIDAIETTSLRLQAKILHMLESGEYLPPDQDLKVKTDIRLIAASHLNLRVRAQAGLFNHDLIDVLGFDVITLPPLRARKIDIVPLSEHFAIRMVTDLGEDSFPGFSAEVLEFLPTYEWPGNVRELKNVIERAVARAWNDERGLSAPITQINIDPFDTPWPITAGPLKGEPIAVGPIGEPEHTDTVPEAIPKTIPEATGTSFTERADAFELSIIREALAYTNNHQGKAAQYLDLTYHQFRGLLRKHGLKK